jgi:hypothetical protein
MSTETIFVLAENVLLYDLIYPWDDLINPLGNRCFEVSKIVKTETVICFYLSYEFSGMYVKYISKHGDKEKILVRSK